MVCPTVAWRSVTFIIYCFTIASRAGGIFPNLTARQILSHFKWSHRDGWDGRYKESEGLPFWIMVVNWSEGAAGLNLRSTLCCRNVGGYAARDLLLQLKGFIGRNGRSWWVADSIFRNVELFSLKRCGIRMRTAVNANGRNLCIKYSCLLARLYSGWHPFRSKSFEWPWDSTLQSFSKRCCCRRLPAIDRWSGKGFQSEQRFILSLQPWRSK